MATRSRTALPVLTLFGVLAGVLLGVGAYTFQYAEGFSYLSSAITN